MILAFLLILVVAWPVQDCKPNPDLAQIQAVANAVKEGKPVPYFLTVKCKEK